jgi:hypothetical protein
MDINLGNDFGHSFRGVSYQLYSCNALIDLRQIINLHYMKYVIIIVLFVLPLKITAQTNSEIIAWINSYEDSYAVERLVEGSYADKVSLSLGDKGKLVITEGIWTGSSTPRIELISAIDLSKIKRVYGGEPREINGMAIVDIYICVEPGFIKMRALNLDGTKVHYLNPDEILEKWGHCNMAIRLKFSPLQAAENTERVVNAIIALAKNNGSNPKVGSLF